MRTVVFILLFTLSNSSFAKLGMRFDDKLRIAEAVNLSNKFGESIWKGFTRVPFTILLVTDDYEYLIHHDAPSIDFALLEYDSILESNIYYRKTVFNKYFLATFPAVNGINCIVVGTPENTNKNSSQWIITLLHEHFHQYVNVSPNYFSEVEKLDLAKGDTSGMWMLNYPFPYDDANTKQAYEDYAFALNELIINLNGKKSFNKNYRYYKSTRKKFEKSLSKDDYAYFSFQLWQEGIARYTELKFLELLENYVPSTEITHLQDFESFQSLKKEFIETEIENIKTMRLETAQRVCFYAVGMAEGILLDRLNPYWRSMYLKDKFYLENYK